MPKLLATLIVITGAGLTAACGGIGGVANRERPDEFAVQRQAPLVIPPDFALTPPAPGAPRPTEGTAAEQALQALFGGAAPRSAVETSALRRAGTAETAIRSTAGDPSTYTVDKGSATRTIVSAPESEGQDARALTTG